ncbi:MAG: sigma-70 family RNA polymerase sigma factor [Gemmatimonadaceae bacterium]
MQNGVVANEGTGGRDHQFRVEALRWLPEVTRFALSLERDEANADDLVQETFLKAYEAWHTYTPGTECRGWLFTICKNTFYKRRTREDRHVSCDDPELEALAAVAVHASAQQGGYADLFTRFDLSDAIDAAIAALPEAFREVVILIELNDQSYESAAALLDVPIGTVRSRLFRARRLLQEALINHARDAGLVRSRLNAGISGEESR